jgi:hypothetical protein
LKLLLTKLAWREISVSLDQPRDGMGWWNDLTEAERACWGIQRIVTNGYRSQGVMAQLPGGRSLDWSCWNADPLSNLIVDLPVKLSFPQLRQRIRQSGRLGLGLQL